MRISDSITVQRWRLAFALVAAVVTLSLEKAAAQSNQSNSSIGINPYYTGSLLSPSPAISTQGLLAFEPYVIYTANPGKYGPRGGLAPRRQRSDRPADFHAAEICHHE